MLVYKKSLLQGTWHVNVVFSPSQFSEVAINICYHFLRYICTGVFQHSSMYRVSLLQQWGNIHSSSASWPRCVRSLMSKLPTSTYCVFGKIYELGHSPTQMSLLASADGYMFRRISHGVSREENKTEVAKNMFFFFLPYFLCSSSVTLETPFSYQ